MEQFRARIGSALVALVIAVGSASVLAGPALAAAPADREASAQAEAAAEAAEEAAEAREAAQAGAWAQLEPRYAARIARLDAKIAVIRESIHFTVHLSHETTRWIVHLPKKRRRVKALRAQIRVVRAAARQASQL
jgi:hypothetical protein